VHDSLEEMAMATVRMVEHVQTMGRPAATVVSLDVIASVIAIANVIASWWETSAAEQLEMRRVHWQGPRRKGAWSASYSEGERTSSGGAALDQVVVRWRAGARRRTHVIQSHELESLAPVQ